MIIIYGSHSYDFIAIADSLKAQGLQQFNDYRIVNELCYRTPHETVSKVYTNNLMIKQDYEHIGVEVSNAVE